MSPRPPVRTYDDLPRSARRAVDRQLAQFGDDLGRILRAASSEHVARELIPLGVTVTIWQQRVALALRTAADRIDPATRPSPAPPPPPRQMPVMPPASRRP